MCVFVYVVWYQQSAGGPIFKPFITNHLHYGTSWGFAAVRGVVIFLAGGAFKDTPESESWYLAA